MTIRIPESGHVDNNLTPFGYCSLLRNVFRPDGWKLYKIKSLISVLEVGLLEGVVY